MSILLATHEACVKFDILRSDVPRQFTEKPCTIFVHPLICANFKDQFVKSS